MKLLYLEEDESIDLKGNKTSLNKIEKVKSNLDTNIAPQVNKAKEDIENLTGSIKRQL